MNGESAHNNSNSWLPWLTGLGGVVAGVAVTWWNLGGRSSTEEESKTKTSHAAERETVPDGKQLLDFLLEAGKLKVWMHSVWLLVSRLSQSECVCTMTHIEMTPSGFRWFKTKVL